MVQSWAAPLVVRNGGSGGAGHEVQTAGNAGSEPLIFVPRAARSYEANLRLTCCNETSINYVWEGAMKCDNFRRPSKP